MTWTAEEQRHVARALLGSWPGTISQWGQEGIAAHLEAVEARGVSAESTLIAIRAWPAAEFPPSAPTLAAAARRAAFREWGRTGRTEVLPADVRRRFADRELVRATIRRELEMSNDGGL